MFPISDSVRAQKFPLVTIALIAINIYVFYLEVTSANPDAFIMKYSLIPSSVHLLNLSTLLPFLTSIFVHGGFLHIISNMWFLWIFGDAVESHLGKIKYLLLFLATGILGNVGQFLLDPSSSIPMLGASGAISGILGGYFLLFPRATVKSLIVLFLFITIIEIRAIFYIFYWFILQILSGAASLSLAPSQEGVAFWAHIAGFVGGILLTGLLRRKNTEIIEGEIVE